MLLLRTIDGGLTWTEIKGAPALEKGEVSFAASGTGIRCSNKNQITISTGGTVSRLWISKNKGQEWESIAVPILQGESSMGIFSFIQVARSLTIVGGDYNKDSLTIRHNYYSPDKGKNWLTPIAPTRGYRECVEIIDKSVLIAVGPTGTDITHDNGIRWKPLSDEKGLHVVRKSRKGSLIILAGGKGKLFVLKKSN